jgi:drug/metabolite transporter (DMT)-like permease
MGNDPGKLEAPKLFRRRSKGRPTAEPEVATPEVEEPADAPSPVPAPVDQVEHVEHPRAPRPPRRPLNPYAVCVAVGLVTGALLAGLTWAALQIGDAGRGAFLVVLLVFVLAVTAGIALLRLTRVGSAGTVAFLATGVVAVVAMLVGSDTLESWAGAAGVVVAAMLAYPAVHWLTASYIDT